MQLLDHSVRSSGTRTVSFWAKLARRSALLALSCLITSSVFAQEQQITRVEEDWCIVVGTPIPEEDTPQLTCVMSSGADLSAHHAVLEINHSTLPSYAAGGLELQLWQGDTNLSFNNFPHNGRLHHIGETVHFTNTMEVSGGQLKFEIINGTSSTWDSFGGQGYLKQTVATSQTDLSSYSPDVSVKYSRIGFASNRVQKFVLCEVRYYNGDTLVRTDSEDRVLYVHE